MVTPQPSKLMTRVRFPPPAPYMHLRSNYQTSRQSVISCIVIFFLVQPIGWLLQFLKVCSYSSAVEHSLGKGEVLSSILNMSSIYCFSLLLFKYSASALLFAKVQHFAKYDILLSIVLISNNKILKIINRVWQLII